MKNLSAKDLVGKTIKQANCSCVNVVVLTFEDDTTLSVWAELGVAGTPHLLVNEPENDLLEASTGVSLD